MTAPCSLSRFFSLMLSVLIAASGSPAGFAAVDPEHGHEHSAHIAETGGHVEVVYFHNHADVCARHS